MGKFSNDGTPGGTTPQGKVGTAKETDTTPQGKVNLSRLSATGRFLFWGGMGFLLLINAQPWLELAREIAKEIKTIPFFESLILIPFIGGWIQWIVTNIVSILGCLLCGIVQWIEALPMFARSAALDKYRWIAYSIETLVCGTRFPPYEGGMQAMLDDMPNWDASLIDWWNIVFFVVAMFGFELALKVIITIWQGTHSYEKANWN